MRQSSRYVWQAPGTNRGAGASAFAGGYTAAAAVPAAAGATPQGPRTIGQDGFGVTVPGMAAGSGRPGLALMWGGGGALALLVILWCALPD